MMKGSIGCLYVQIARCWQCAQVMLTSACVRGEIRCSNTKLSMVLRLGQSISHFLPQTLSRGPEPASRGAQAPANDKQSPGERAGATAGACACESQRESGRDKSRGINRADRANKWLEDIIRDGERGM